MSVHFSCLGLALSLAVLGAACARMENEPQAARAGTTNPGVASATAAPDCPIVARFSRLSFIAADRNEDGVIDEAEFAADVAAAFAGEDRDFDRRLTRAELPDAPSGAFERVKASQDGLTFRQLMAAKLEDFERADTNRDGTLSIVEVSRFNARQEGC